MNNCKYCKADCALRGEENLKECKGHIPMSNADRIRAMSDEELAVLLAHETYRMAKPVFDVCGYGITEEFIFAQRLEWLKQTAEKPKEESEAEEWIE